MAVSHRSRSVVFECASCVLSGPGRTPVQRSGLNCPPPCVRHREAAVPLLSVRAWFCWVGLYCRSKVPLLWSFQWSTEQVTLHACLVEYAWSRLEPRASTRAHEALRGPAWSRGPPDLASRRQAWSSLSCSCYYSLLLHL